MMDEGFITAAIKPIMIMMIQKYPCPLKLRFFLPDPCSDVSSQ